METLAALVAAHGSVLVLDAATTRMQAGLLRSGREPVWRMGGDNAGVHLFAAVRDCLAGSGLRPGGIGAYVFCDGPGGQLGIRTACMALRTWQVARTAPAPVFAYPSLRLAALALVRTGTATPFATIADARRDCWHAVRVDSAGTVSSVLRVPAEEMRAWPEPLFAPEGFRAWSPPPRAPAACPYDLAGLFAALADEPLLIPVAEPEPWTSLNIEYKVWTGERHRGPAAGTPGGPHGQRR